MNETSELRRLKDRHNKLRLSVQGIKSRTKYDRDRIARVEFLAASTAFVLGLFFLIIIIGFAWRMYA